MMEPINTPAEGSAPLPPESPASLTLGTVQLTGETADAIREALRNAEAVGYLRGLGDAKAAESDPAESDPAESTDSEPPVTFPTYSRRSIWE